MFPEYGLEAAKLIGKRIFAPGKVPVHLIGNYDSVGVYIIDLAVYLYLVVCEIRASGVYISYVRYDLNLECRTVRAVVIPRVAPGYPDEVVFSGIVPCAEEIPCRLAGHYVAVLVGYLQVVRVDVVHYTVGGEVVLLCIYGVNGCPDAPHRTYPQKR